MALQIYRAETFRRGLWRNGRGVSWDIASDGGPEDFGWRLALAEITTDAPFSAYPGVDRMITLLAGDGFDLAVAGVGTLAVEEPFVPVAFPGDSDCLCTVRGGPCRVLNLFTRRSHYRADVIIHDGDEPRAIGQDGVRLLFALTGTAMSGATILRAGDAARVINAQDITLSRGAALYEARLTAVA